MRKGTALIALLTALMVPEIALGQSVVLKKADRLDTGFSALLQAPNLPWWLESVSRNRQASFLPTDADRIPPLVLRTPDTMRADTGSSSRSL